MSLESLITIVIMFKVYLGHRNGKETLIWHLKQLVSHGGLYQKERWLYCWA